MRFLCVIIFLILNKDVCSSTTYKSGNFKFEIDPNVKYINGSVTYYFESTVSVDTLLLNLTPQLIVDSISYHNQNISNFYFTPPDFFNIVLPQSSFGIDSIKVSYHGVPPTSGLGSFTLSYHNNVPIVCTLSQPYGASDWMPSINNLKQKFDSVQIQITCPNSYIGIANGLLVKTMNVGNNKTFIYKHKYPIATYLIGISVTNYLRHTSNYASSNSNFIIENYTYPEEETEWMNKAQELPMVMTLFENLFGDYPFKNELYGMGQTNFGGGIENQTMTLMGSYNYEIAAHELAHSWFGNKVTCGSWHDLWLNEGFATYLSGVVYQYTSNGFYWKPFLQGRMASATELNEGSVFIDDTTSIERIFNDKLTYNKAAMVLHQLRYIIGDSAFFKACRNYLNDPSLAYKFATTNDLKQHFETVCGLDLTYYFDQWIYGHGYPIYNITTNDLGNGNTLVQISYNTSSSLTTSFKLPVPIKFVGTNADTTIVFNCESQTENFTVQLGFAPTHYICDPQLNIIAKSNVMLGNNEFDLLNECVVYPTTTSNSLYISCSKNFIKYDVFNSSGALIFSDKVSSAVQNKIDVSTFAKGSYLIKISGISKTEFFKFIVI